MRLKNYICLFLFIFSISFSNAQIERVEPPNWWAGMKNPNLQLMVYGKNIGYLTPTTDYSGVEIKQTVKVENPNYLFIDLKLNSDVKPGKVKIDFSDKGRISQSFDYPLLQREKSGEEYLGFDNSDVLYLITPDRFANGDPSNDNIQGMKETADRTNKGGRHGGDIEGIRKNLDYIKSMGYTAIWLNPVLENDMHTYSYHGYSTTDFYKVDPRFGTNESYRNLAQEAKEKGIDLIMDMIVNHCGSEHWWMYDLPCSDWINQWEDTTYTNHRKTVLQDPYAAKIDKKIFTDGWFVETMPDMNQRNPQMANYLTQNGIWWIEYLGLAGIRMDTYPYPDEDYMTEWTRRVMEEYQNFNVVGEEWYLEPTIVSYWQKGKNNPNGYTSELTSVMDFPLQTTMVKGLNSTESWGSGFIKMYEMLAHDFLYPNPNILVTFPDNHDMTRIYSQLNENYDLWKSAMIYTATMRGIPQIYYGTEILMTSSGDHGIIRSDFPGGWADDEVNGFSGEGLSEQAKSAQNFTKKLLNWRKTASAVQTGKLTHFEPKNGVYVYFRYDKEQKIMVVLNKNPELKSLDLGRFSEMLEGVSRGTEVLSGRSFDIEGKVEISGIGGFIFELK